MLPNIGNDRELLKQLKQNWREASIDEETRAILGLAEKITLQPSSLRESDLNLLREKGLSDRLVLDVVLIAAQSNLTNRISLSLGVEPSR